MTTWLGVSVPWLLAGLAVGTAVALWIWGDARRHRREADACLARVLALRAERLRRGDGDDKPSGPVHPGKDAAHIRIHRAPRGNGHAVSPWNVKSD